MDVLGTLPTEENISFRFTYAIGNASWKNGFDDDAGATSADNAESKTTAIVDKIYDFNLSPFRIQLGTKRSQKDLKNPSYHQTLIILSNNPLRTFG